MNIAYRDKSTHEVYTVQRIDGQMLRIENGTVISSVFFDSTPELVAIVPDDMPQGVYGINENFKLNWVENKNIGA